MWASYDDGFTVFLGEDVANSVKDVLNTKCSNPADAGCVSGVIDALGAFPAVAPVEKRGIALAMAGAIGKISKGPLLPLAVALGLPGLWNWLQEDEKAYKTISIHIPAAQTSAVADMSIGVDGVFEYASMTGAPGKFPRQFDQEWRLNDSLGAVVTAVAQPSPAPE
jgi:hypothetical protein